MNLMEFWKGVTAMDTERELLSPVMLCAPGGRLNPAAKGWSRHPLHTCNLQGSWPRKKRWNYWCITTARHLFSVTLSDLDYMGLAFVYALEFATGRFAELTVMRPFGQGCHLPDTVLGSFSFRHPHLDLSCEESPGRTRLRVSSNRFGGERLEADLNVERPPGHETLNVVVPWSASRFQFTSKQQCLLAAGEIHWGRETIRVDAGEGFACLDFGRGIWPYSCEWNWGAFSALQPDGRTVGVNLGGRWTDGTGFTENGIVVDGRLSKLSEPVAFQYDSVDFKRPWQVRTPDSGRIDLTFVPFFERVAKTDLLLLRSEVHQLIGRFSGTVTDDSGERIAIHDAVGWAEEHQARW